jgi:glycosyltransferase involved in cell wall biosynthesis
MNILFLHPRHKLFDTKTVRDEPCGGTEKAIIYLGEAFIKLGHKVRWVTSVHEAEQLNDQAFTSWPDVVITQEAELLMLFPLECRKVWWCHHFTNQDIIQRNSGYGRAFADKVVTLSQCQAQDFKENLRLDTVTIGYGVWGNEVKQGDRDPYRLIYASTPFRGLELIPELWPKIKAAHPKATLAVCSSMATYGVPEQDQPYQELFEKLKALDGVELLGALNQHQLFDQMARASVFFYPCTWAETYCLVMDEAIAHGCKPMTSGLAALGERAWVYDFSKDFWLADLKGSLAGSNFTIDKMVEFDKGPTSWLLVAMRWDEKVLNG